VNEPFRARAEIQAIIGRGQPDDDDRQSRREVLCFTRTRIEEFLRHVREHASLPRGYPTVAFAAYSGARRSEICVGW
jgi:hypothetical protein